MNNQYIIKMSGSIQRARGYGQDGFELIVTVSFDAKQFNAIKKQKQDPLATAMAQIKNVVLDGAGVRGMPSYSRPSMNQAYPRAKQGLITLQLSFDISEFSAKELGADVKKNWCLYHKVELQKTLDATRDDGHLFAKSVLASMIGGSN